MRRSADLIQRENALMLLLGNIQNPIIKSSNQYKMRMM